MEQGPLSPSKEMESLIDPQVKKILHSLAPEEIDMLRDAFIYMDKDSDGYVNREEMMQQVARCVGKERFGPLCSYLSPLFVVADKDEDQKLSLTEFLMSFSEGPGVVPAEVINSCVANIRVRFTDEEISSLQESFRSFDVNQDGFLDKQELETALRKLLAGRFPDLTDESFKEIVTVVMATADADQDGKLCLSEFIRSFQEDQGVLPAAFIEARGYDVPRELTVEEANVLREAFAALDKNNDGYVDFIDIYNALWEALANRVEDKSQIEDVANLIMATADRRKCGRLTVSDFVISFLRNMDLMQIPVAIGQEKVNSACARLQQMHDSGELSKLVIIFEDLDSNKDGYLNRDEMVSVLMRLFRDAYPEWEEKTLFTVMTAIVAGAHIDDRGRLTLEEFIRSFVEGPGILPPAAIEHWEHSTSRPTSASNEELQRISDTLRDLNAIADADGCVPYDALRSYVVGAFSEDPSKGEEMFRYVLDRFVNILEDGRVAWNENVQIVEISDDEGQAVSAAAGKAEQPAGLSSPSLLSAATPRPTAARSEPLSKEKEVRNRSNSFPVRTTSLPTATPRSGTTLNRNTGSLELGNAKKSTQSTAPVAVPTATPLDTFAPSKSNTAVVSSKLTQSKREEKTITPKLASESKLSIVDHNALPNHHDSMVGDSIFEDELRQLFIRFDRDGLGYLDRNSFKKVYMSMEQYGLEPTQAEIDNQIAKYSRGSNKIFFDEFCVLMLHRVSL